MMNAAGPRHAAPGVPPIYYVYPGVAPAPSAPRTAAAAPRTAARPPMFDYEFVPTRDVDATYRAACAETLRRANRLLGGAADGIQVAFFTRYSGVGRYEFSSPNNVGGRVEPSGGLIWIVVGMPLAEAVRAVAHETKHIEQVGGFMAAAERESDASIFAAAFYRRHGSSIEAWANGIGRFDRRS